MELKKIILYKYNELSKGQQKVANYLLEMPKDFAMKSANEIGTKAGVSETTVIRFCYAINLSGYSDLQKKVREQLLFQESSLGEYHSTKLQLAEEPNFFAKVMEKDREQIKEMMALINEDQLNQLVDQIVKADAIYISGLGTSFPAANWLSFTLGLVKDRVKIVRSDTDDIVFTLSGMNNQSVMIAISFHRYLKETIKIGRLAKKQGAYIVGITDSPNAPVSEFSDMLFPIFPFKKSSIDTTTALFSFLNAVVAGVTVKNSNHFEKRKEQYEELFKDDFFVDGGDAI
ncbi:MurR/RpiR family transcriptional regulator [Bacillus sp. S/N-304-OC-R1]|uniref:MurR/RpiR family transcriptional regulator n=1 Tax=Bacillus sp. S/N-304-OC-R1 TaxID=2758034 RepID=UPI001C8D137A|nr:MurR/RpiR family transcriptional regulator [Bacillus sp. S/N-304-OC-R1]MBY0121421.1 MurR/RpiR family transcriptional regulator [Bacillus sp. S/N-304-OC-R1]